MVENLNRTIQDMAEKGRELKELIPSFLKGEKLPEKGTVDIYEPVSRKNGEGFTEYQRELLSKEYGLSEEEIAEYSDWDDFEQRVIEEKEPNGADDPDSLIKVQPKESEKPSFPIDPRISEKSESPCNTDEQNKRDINGLQKDNSVDFADKGAYYNDTRCPTDHGRWEGERGNSKWIPDGEYVPPEKGKPDSKPYSNPDKLRWKDILAKYGIDGIPFKDGYPDFSDISRGTVKIEGFESGGNDAKNRNFRKADIALAKQRGCTPQEVAKWRKDNNYTWHECEDKKTMMKVPNEVHANVPHDGGRSQKE